MTQATTILGLIAALGAAVVAARYLVRTFGEFMDVLEALAAVVKRELTPNGGSSMKDHMADLATDVRELKGIAGDHGARLAAVETHIKRTERADRHVI